MYHFLATRNSVLIDKLPLTDPKKRGWDSASLTSGRNLLGLLWFLQGMNNWNKLTLCFCGEHWSSGWSSPYPHVCGSAGRVRRGQSEGRAAVHAEAGPAADEVNYCQSPFQWKAKLHVQNMAFAGIRKDSQNLELLPWWRCCFSSTLRP